MGTAKNSQTWEQLPDVNILIAENGSGFTTKTNVSGEYSLNLDGPGVEMEFVLRVPIFDRRYHAYSGTGELPGCPVYYDIGNLSYFCHDINSEIRWLGAEHICQFHIKNNPPFFFRKAVLLLSKKK